MNKILKIVILVTVILLIGFFIFNNRDKRNNRSVNEIKNKTENHSVKTKEDSLKKVTVTKGDTKLSDTEIKNKVKSKKDEDSDRKKYINREIGISFKYPIYWEKSANEIKATDLNGNIKSIEIHFTDTVFGGQLTIKFNPNPGGTELYNYLLSQFEKSEGIYKSEKKEVTIAGYKAISGTSIRKIDGRGHKIDPPSKLTTIDLFCDKLSGKLELQFRTQVGNDTAEFAFQELIKTIEIIK